MVMISSMVILYSAELVRLYISFSLLEINEIISFSMLSRKVYLLHICLGLIRTFALNSATHKQGKH